MTTTHKNPKIGIIIVLAALATYLHYHSAHGNLSLHLVHRELFFLPIMLAAFWFGIKGGLFSSLAISIIYAPHVINFSDPHGEFYTVTVQLFTFLLIGTVLGWLVHRREISNKEKMYLDETFGRYVPQKIRKHVINGNPKLDSSICQITVLVIKIQNIHTAIEKLPPWQVVELINTYFSEMADIALESDGLMIGFSEDEFKVLYGAPVAQPHHKEIGIQTALKMRRQLKLMNAVFAEKELPILIHNIGIHTGLALGASIGSTARQTYNVVGSTVRIAQLIRERCEAEGQDILVSDEVLTDIRPLFNAGKLAPRLQHFGDSVGLNTVSSKETVEE